MTQSIRSPESGHLRLGADTCTRRTLAGLLLGAGMLPALPKLARAEAALDPVGLVNGFGHDLFVASLGAAENLVLSPLSLGLCSAMAAFGAAGISAAEFEAAFRLPSGGSRQLPEAMSVLVGKLKRAPGLAVANGLAFARDESLARPDYVAQVKESFDAEVMTDATPRSVNAWVSRKTNGKITHLLDDLAGLVLLNALYFSGRWQNPAAKWTTKPGPFVTAAGATLSVPLMVMGGIRGIERPGFEAFTLPYEQGKAAMVVVLPARNRSAASLAPTLDPQLMRTLLADPSGRHGQDLLMLPRFKISFEGVLNKAYEALKVGSIFDPSRADFGGMKSEPGPMFLSQVLHRTFVEVDEEGTVAAAATAMPMAAGARPAPPPKVYVIDRPFLFHLVDLMTGAVLMQGLVNEPSRAVA